MTVKDPVCGMDVETGGSSITAEHDGKTYHFCSTRCRETFLKNPGAYVGKSNGTGQDHDHARH